MSPVVKTDPNILGGTPVFPHTRVPIKTFLDYRVSQRIDLWYGIRAIFLDYYRWGGAIRWLILRLALSL